MSDIVLAMRKVSKSFPGVKALHNVDFTLNKGEIHALMGENGAGKSTLIKVLTGVHLKESGTISIDGTDSHVTIRSPQEAQKMGISTVYQEISLCPNLTVAENIFIGRDGSYLVNAKKMESKATDILQKLKIPVQSREQLGSCSLAVQQMIAVARAVDMECKVLILDEPTSSLDEQEVELLFSLMRDLKSKGVGIIFITHFLDQVYKISDRITVLRNGELVGEFTTNELPKVNLVSAMMGKNLEDISELKKEHHTPNIDDVPVYEASNLTSTANIKPFDFHIKKGEVNGFTGLLGSGRTECVRAIFGADKLINGSMRINGRPVKISKPRDSIKQGIGYLSEDRKYDGIIDDLSVRENIVLALQALRGIGKPLSRAEADKYAQQYIKQLGIKTASIETPIKSLSGGNQQKAILARWLLLNPQYLILDEPTRGIDVGTKVEIQKHVLKLAEEGVSVTFISSEIEEMLATCSRLIVMRDRQVVGELTGNELTQSNIMHTIAGDNKTYDGHK